MDNKDHKNNKDRLEEFLQNSFEDYTDAPSNSVWDNIEQGLDTDLPGKTGGAWGRTLSISYKWMAFVGTIVLVLGISQLIYFNQKIKKLETKVEQHTEQVQNQIGQTQVERIEQTQTTQTQVEKTISNNHNQSTKNNFYTNTETSTLNTTKKIINNNTITANTEKTTNKPEKITQEQTNNQAFDKEAELLTTKTTQLDNNDNKSDKSESDNLANNQVSNSPSKDINNSSINSDSNLEFKEQITEEKIGVQSLKKIESLEEEQPTNVISKNTITEVEKKTESTPLENKETSIKEPIETAIGLNQQNNSQERENQIIDIEQQEEHEQDQNKVEYENPINKADNSSIQEVEKEAIGQTKVDQDQEKEKEQSPIKNEAITKSNIELLSPIQSENLQDHSSENLLDNVAKLEASKDQNIQAPSTDLPQLPTLGKNKLAIVAYNRVSANWKTIKNIKKHSPRRRNGRDVPEFVEEIQTPYWANNSGINLRIPLNTNFSIETGIAYKSAAFNANHKVEFKAKDVRPSGGSGGSGGSSGQNEFPLPDELTFRYDLNTSSCVHDATITLSKTSNETIMIRNDEKLKLDIQTKTQSKQLSVPLLFNYKTNNYKWNLRAQAGFIYNYMLEEKRTVEDISVNQIHLSFDTKNIPNLQSVSSSKHTLNYLLGLGFQYNLNEQISFELIPSFSSTLLSGENTKHIETRMFSAALNTGFIYHF